MISSSRPVNFHSSLNHPKALLISATERRNHDRAGIERESQSPEGSSYLCNTAIEEAENAKALEAESQSPEGSSYLCNETSGADMSAANNNNTSQSPEGSSYLCNRQYPGGS